MTALLFAARLWLAEWLYRLVWWVQPTTTIEWWYDLELDGDDAIHSCPECGALMQQTRPGEWECPNAPHGEVTP